MYNQFVQGNAELLSISSNDSIWNSDDETEETSNAAPRNNPSKQKHSTSKIRGLCLMKFSLSFFFKYRNNVVLPLVRIS